MKTEYREIYEFLEPYRSIWVDSILQNWPHSSSAFPRAWIDAIATLDESALREFAQANAVPGLPPDLLRIIERADAFEKPLQGSIAPLNSMECQGLNLKKQHEIERLLPILNGLNGGVTHAVDIGGGQGHLARICVARFHWRFHTIDRDEKLQDKGRWWLNRTRNFEREKLIFVNGEFSNTRQDLDLYFSAPETLSIGLHTCGSLAVTQFRKSLGSQRILNFGCCYDKTAASDLNLSETAKSRPIPWNSSSLFLATRSRKDLSPAEFALLRRVNDYRFTFDLLMREAYPEKGFVIAGDAPKSLYEGPFADYVRNRLEKLKFPALADARITGFREKARAEVFAIFAAHLIRNLFARPLERLLLLDRGIWLEEQGFTVELKNVFDPKISPRNLALIARR